MTLIKWLGEEGGPDVNVWNGVTFKKGVPVECNDEYMLAKARTNRYYEVMSGAFKGTPSAPPPLKKV